MQIGEEEEVIEVVPVAQPTTLPHPVEEPVEAPA